MVAASSSAEGTIARRIKHAEATVAGTMKRDNEHFSSRRNLERASLSLSDESESNLSINNKNDLESARPHYSMDKLSSGSGNRIVVAVYGYSGTQENQLSFAEGDKICLIGDNISGSYTSICMNYCNNDNDHSLAGWRFGENVKSKAFGWFPSSYVDGTHPK
jgi:hypothetical protein